MKDECSNIFSTLFSQRKSLSIVLHFSKKCFNRALFDFLPFVQRYEKTQQKKDKIKRNILKASYFSIETNVCNLAIQHQ